MDKWAATPDHHINGTHQGKGHGGVIISPQFQFETTENNFGWIHLENRAWFSFLSNSMTQDRSYFQQVDSCFLKGFGHSHSLHFTQSLTLQKAMRKTLRRGCFWKPLWNNGISKETACLRDLSEEHISQIGCWYVFILLTTREPQLLSPGSMCIR